MTRFSRIGFVAIAAALLASCAEKELILPGQRLDIRTPLEDSRLENDPAGAAPVLRPVDTGVPENRSLAPRLPGAQNIGSWPQRALNPEHRLPHLAMSGGLNLLWAADIGQGNDRRHRLTGDPVSDGARIYTLDSRARVTAVAPSGGVVWTADITPPEDGENDASGGGLALAGGRLFVSSGFGIVTALDAATGRQIWTQRLGAVGGASPTVRDGLVYVMGRDSRAWAVRADDGRVVWAVSGAIGSAGYVGGGGAAVNDRVAVLPYPSAGVTTVLKRSGIRSWSTQIPGQRVGKVSASVTDIASDPVLDGNTLYAANASGRLVAANAGNGERIWTATEGSLTPVVLAGGSIYMVTDNAEVVRLEQETGARIWGTALPDFEPVRNQRRRKAVYAHYGPLLVSGRLLVASSDGLFRFYNPADGTLAGTAQLPGGAASNPIVVNGTLYIIAGNGRLLAFR